MLGKSIENRNKENVIGKKVIVLNPIVGENVMPGDTGIVVEILNNFNYLKTEINGKIKYLPVNWVALMDDVEKLLKLPSKRKQIEKLENDNLLIVNKTVLVNIDMKIRAHEVINCNTNNISTLNIRATNHVIKYCAGKVCRIISRLDNDDEIYVEFEDGDNDYIPLFAVRQMTSKEKESYDGVWKNKVN